MCEQKSTTWTKFSFGYTMTHIFSSNPQLAIFFALVQAKDLMASLFLFNSTLVVVLGCLVPQQKRWEETPLQLEEGALKFRRMVALAGLSSEKATFSVEQATSKSLLACIALCSLHQLFGSKLYLLISFFLLSWDPHQVLIFYLQ